MTPQNLNIERRSFLYSKETKFNIKSRLKRSLDIRARTSGKSTDLKTFLLDVLSDVNPEEQENDKDVRLLSNLFLTKKKQQEEMPSRSVLMDADDFESFNSFGESFELSEFSDSESVALTIDSFSDQIDDSVSSDVLSEDGDAAAKDDRPFLQFFEEENLVEVKREWKKYEIGSLVEIKSGALWIAGEKTHVVVSKATQEKMKKEGVWGKELFIGKDGYVTVGRDFASLLHTKLAASKKDSDFHNLLEAGWEGQKKDLEVLHLNDCPYDFNIENLQWNTHAANLLLKLSKGGPNRKKFRCSTNINEKMENATGCSTLLEARHAVDLLKISNVDPIHQDLVFHHGLNYVYPSLEVLLSRTHLYKTNPSHQGKPFKSTAEITLLDWKYADAGLKKAVEDSKIPFDPTQDVLVKYVGKKGKGIKLMFVMVTLTLTLTLTLKELNCYNNHILNQHVTLKLTHGYVHIKNDDFRLNGIHRLVLGLKTGDKAKVGRHLVDGMDGKRGMKLKVLYLILS